MDVLDPKRLVPFTQQMNVPTTVVGHTVSWRLAIAAAKAVEKKAEIRNRSCILIV
jgi:hypothetical protein